MTGAPVKRFDDIAMRLDAIIASQDAALVAAAPAIADELLALGEIILESWLSARRRDADDAYVRGLSSAGSASAGCPRRCELQRLP